MGTRNLAEEPGDPSRDQNPAGEVDSIAGELVSVLLPCHNAAGFLSEALDSVLTQTHDELEVVAVDDGSQDATLDLLREAAAGDERIRVFGNPENKGIIRTLNRAVAEASGEFVARMDADDLLAPDRIEHQLEILLANPAIGVIGSAALAIDESGAVIGRLPVRCTDPAAAPFLALMATPMMHPTVMARAQVMRAFPYRSDPECLHVEDYDLFIRMLDDGVQLQNSEAPLYKKRAHAAGVSSRFEPVQVTNFVALARRQLERIWQEPVSDAVHRVLVNRMEPTTTPHDLRRGLNLLDRLRDRYLAGTDRQPKVSSEVRAIADQQRFDILGQAILKGPLRRRVAGMALLARYSPALRGADARQYLRGKFADRRLAF